MPVLPSGVAIDALEARIAFHLHRLGLTGTALSTVTESRSDAADIAAARVRLSSQEAERLALRLGVPSSELTRPLRPEETDAWTFYMRSAAKGPEMWLRAVGLAEAHGLSRRGLGQIIRVDRRNLARALAGTSRIVFTDVMADALADTLHVDVRQILSRDDE